MEARSVDAIPRGSEWQYEPKWDGFRCLLSRHGDKVELRSKSGEDLTRYFTELVEAARKLKATDFVLDGEIVVPRGKAFSFDDLLQRLTRKTTSCPPSRSAKGDKQPRRFLRQFFDAARGGMNPLMERSAIRVAHLASVSIHPGLRFAPSGLRSSGPGRKSLLRRLMDTRVKPAYDEY